jgi:outer membrane protein assembly factor BamD
MPNVTKLLLITFLLVGAGCAGGIDDPTKDWTAERFYTEAKARLENGAYEEAIKMFETLEGRFPYGRYAEQAQLEIAYANFKNEEPALAIAAADRFIRLHPTHPNVDYAYYLKGIVNFRAELSFTDWLLGNKSDYVDRNPKASRDAYDVFRELVDRFPKSRYAPDARKRMVFLFDMQARYEINVARFYFKRGAYVAAVNRSKYVLETYPRTPSIEDALGIQAMSYAHMRMPKLRDDTVRVLQRNFPESHYFEKLRAVEAKLPAPEKS